MDVRRGVVVFVAIQALLAGTPASARQDARPEPYLRVVEEQGGDSIALEVASREFGHADPAKPVVHLTGAVHIADRAFYDALQGFLDAQDVVLFEGVKPPGAGADSHDEDLDDAARIATTEHRLRFLAIAAEKYKAAHGRYPDSLEELTGGLEARIAALVSGSRDDAWGRGILYTLPPPPVPPAEDAPVAPHRPRPDFLSLGSDGVQGGAGAGTDLRFSDQKPLSRGEKGGGEGIQQQLADAMGLVFQLSAMDENKPNWRNSDLSIDQVQRRLDEADAGGDVLFSMLDGSSMLGRLAGVLVRALGATAQGRAMFKVMLAELLSNADEMLRNLPGEMGALMDVIIKDRNAIVIEDLERVIETEPHVRTVAIIYGAGHLPDLEERLATLGYAPKGDTWRPAIRVSSEGEKLPKGSVRQLRPMIKSVIDTQVRQLERVQRRADEKRGSGGGK